MRRLSPSACYAWTPEGPTAVAPRTANVPIARQLQGDFIADYSIWPLIKPRVLRIMPRPVYRVGE